MCACVCVKQRVRVRAIKSVRAGAAALAVPARAYAIERSPSAREGCETHLQIRPRLLIARKSGERHAAAKECLRILRLGLKQPAAALGCPIPRALLQVALRLVEQARHLGPGAATGALMKALRRPSHEAGTKGGYKRVLPKREAAAHLHRVQLARGGRWLHERRHELVGFRILLGGAVARWDLRPTSAEPDSSRTGVGVMPV